jgi:taurine dioxygenase
MRAVHGSAHIFGRGGVNDQNSEGTSRYENHDKVGADVPHPVVIRHPLSGRKALYVNPAFTLRFENWSAEDSRPLLEHLYRHAARPEFTCRFRWQEGSIALWDNRATWHYAANDYQGERRLMHRVTVAGCALQAATGAAS